MALLRCCQQSRPDLSFHQQPQARLEVVEKPRHGRRAVPRLPNLHITGLQQTLAGGAARGGAMREQQPQPRLGLAQRVEQNAGSAGFAQRHGMHPHQFGPRLCGLAKVVKAAKALVDGHAIAGLAACTSHHLAPQQRLGQPHQQAVKAQKHAFHARLSLDGPARC